MGVVTGAVIAAGAAAVAANQKKVAATRALNAQQAALDKVKGVDINAVAQDAKAQDVQKYKDQFALLSQVDPNTAAFRDAANRGLIEQANGDANSTNANQILQGLFDSNVKLDPADADFMAKLKAKAAQQLDLGGKLSPDQQAEFVRAGLEQSAGSGFDPSSSASRQGIGKLLASESNALELQRQNVAKELFGFATDLNTTRNQNLLGIAGAAGNKSALDQQKLLQLAALGDSRVPNVGLSGGDIANLAVGNNNQANNVTVQRGAANANYAGVNGEITAGLIGNIASAAGGLAGAYGSGAGLLSGRSGVGAPTTYADFLKNNPNSSAARY